MADRRTYHHGDLREALLDAVLTVVAEEGVHAVKVSALARRCGVSSGAPFRHFTNREALLVAAAERAVDGQLAAMDAAAEQVTDPLEAERARGVAYIRWAVEHPGAFRLLQDPALIRASERLTRQAEAFQSQLDGVLGARQVGEVAPEMARRTAGALAGMALLGGLAKMLVDGALGERTPEEAERLAWEVTGVLGEGLGG